MLEHDADIGEFQGHVPVVRRKLTREQYLYRAGQAVHALYIVDVGFLKMSELSDDGREQVTGFRMGGDWIGLESIGLTQRRCDAMALDLSYVWELPIERTLAACMEARALQARLHEALARIVGRTVTRGHRWAPWDAGMRWRFAGLAPAQHDGSAGLRRLDLGQGGRGRA